MATAKRTRGVRKEKAAARRTKAPPTAARASANGDMGGSDVAPTRKAETRERTRHRAERQVGRQAAGVGKREGQAAQRRRGTSSASRAALTEAARIADEAVGGDDRRRKQ